MNILVIAPHPDDEAIGCGGALCAHRDSGARISVVFLTSGELGLKHLPRQEAWAIRESEASKAGQVLGVANMDFLRCSDWTLGQEIAKASALLGPLLQEQSPDVIYVPHPAEAHPDHSVALPLVQAAWKLCSFSAPNVRLYEVWTPLSSYDIVQDISELMPQKTQALREHASQLKDLDYVQAVTGLNQYRGALAGRCKFAEVFAQTNL
jgi:LmbE family N-acetylglucosaminyl deacetylase